MNTPLQFNTSASASWQRGGQCHLRAPDGTAIAPLVTKSYNLGSAVSGHNDM